MRAVNLLPDQQRAAGSQWRDWRPTSPPVVGAAAAVLVVGLLGVLFFGARGDVADKERQVAELREEQTRAAAARHTSADSPARQQREAAVAAAVAQRVAWDVMLTRLARIVPPDVELTTFAATAPGAVTGSSTATATPSPTGAPTDFTLSGVASSHRAVARLLTRLSFVPGLVDPQLGSTQGGGEGDKVQFTISAGIEPKEIQA